MNPEPVSPETSLSLHDPVRVFFDWHYQLNRNVLFNLTAKRSGKKSHVEFLVDLPALSEAQAEKLLAFLTRYHAHETTSEQIAGHAAWLLELAMSQQGKPAQKRNAEIEKLLLLNASGEGQAVSELEPLSPKRALFELRGQWSLIESGRAVFFEESKTLTHYPEVQLSWLGAVESINFGTPKLDPYSTDDELFFLELRHQEDPGLVFSKYGSSLIRARNQAFWDAVAKVLAARPIPDNTKPALSYYLVGAWLHSFFWGLNNEDRLLLLSHYYDVSKISEKTLRRTITALGLKDWSDFRQTYREPPFVMTRFKEAGQELCQISLRQPGQF